MGARALAWGAGARGFAPRRVRVCRRRDPNGYGCAAGTASEIAFDRETKSRPSRLKELEGRDSTSVGAGSTRVSERQNVATRESSGTQSL
jgi:hypothetical protein